jgi:hypothetical protein
MTTLVIALMWIVTIALMFGTLYVIGNVGFWVFAQVFGFVDQYLQDRHFRKLGLERMKDENGNDWYVG